MNKQTKKLALYTLLILFAFGQTTQVAAWSFSPYLPSFSKSSLSSFATKKVLIPLCTLATAVAAYTVYKYWPWKKSDDSTGTHGSSNPSTSPTSNDSRVLSLIPLKKDLEPQTITAPRELQPVDSREEMSPGALADARTTASDFADSDRDDETNTAAAAAVTTLTNPSENSSAASSAASSPSPRTDIASKAPTPEPTTDFTNSYKNIETKYKIFAFSYNGYYQFEDTNYFKGQRHKNTAKELLNEFRDGLNKDLRIELAKNYKIHLMPKNENMLSIIEELFKKLDEDIEFKKHLNGMKFILQLNPEDLQKERVMPRVVLYPASSKESAQFVLNKICEIFINTEGIDVCPRYNQRVTSLIYYAQGDGDDKDGNPAEYFDEHQNKIFYKPNFTGTTQDFRLTIPACVQGR